MGMHPGSVTIPRRDDSLRSVRTPSGVTWTASGAGRHLMRRTQVCPYCLGQLEETECHVLWDCPRWAIERGEWSRISLGVVGFYANTERFQGLVPLLPHFRPLSVPKGGSFCVVYLESP